MTCAHSVFWLWKESVLLVHEEDVLIYGLHYTHSKKQKLEHAIKMCKYG
jgi:hypothetical protein